MISIAWQIRNELFTSAWSLLLSSLQDLDNYIYLQTNQKSISGDLM